MCQGGFELELKIFGERLQTLRKGKELKQEDMKDLLHITTNHYQKIEYGKINISITTLAQLADFFSVSTDYLLGRADEPDPGQ